MPFFKSPSKNRAELLLKDSRKIQSTNAEFLDGLEKSIKIQADLRYLHDYVRNLPKEKPSVVLKFFERQKAVAADILELYGVKLQMPVEETLLSSYASSAAALLYREGVEDMCTRIHATQFDLLKKTIETTEAWLAAIIALENMPTYLKQWLAHPSVIKVQNGIGFLKAYHEPFSTGPNKFISFAVSESLMPVLKFFFRTFDAAVDELVRTYPLEIDDGVHQKRS